MNDEIECRYFWEELDKPNFVTVETEYGNITFIPMPNGLFSA